VGRRRRGEDDDDTRGPGDTYPSRDPDPTGRFDPVAFGRMQSDVSNQKRNLHALTNRVVDLEDTVEDLAKQVNEGHTQVMGSITDLTTQIQISKTKQGATWKTLTIIGAIVIGVLGLIGTMLSIVSSIHDMRADLHNGPPPRVGPTNPGPTTP